MKACERGHAEVCQILLQQQGVVSATLVLVPLLPLALRCKSCQHLLFTGLVGCGLPGLGW